MYGYLVLNKLDPTNCPQGLPRHEVTDAVGDFTGFQAPHPSVTSCFSYVGWLVVPPYSGVFGVVLGVIGGLVGDVPYVFDLGRVQDPRSSPWQRSKILDVAKMQDLGRGQDPISWPRPRSTISDLGRGQDPRSKVQDLGHGQRSRAPARRPLLE